MGCCGFIQPPIEPVRRRGRFYTARRNQYYPLQITKSQISYASRDQGETKTYPAHPLGFVQRGAVSYLVATLYDYNDIRSADYGSAFNPNMIDKQLAR